MVSEGRHFLLVIVKILSLYLYFAFLLLLLSKYWSSTSCRPTSAFLLSKLRTRHILSKRIVPVLTQSSASCSTQVDVVAHPSLFAFPPTTFFCLDFTRSCSRRRINHSKQQIRHRDLIRTKHCNLLNRLVIPKSMFVLSQEMFCCLAIWRTYPRPLARPQTSKALLTK
jgi:hypothetical protein